MFVHDKAAEEKFLAEGAGVKRHDVMYNDFVIVGPKGDPARAGGSDVAEALRRIATPRRPSSPGATAPAPTRRNCATGRMRGIDLAAVRGDWYKDVGQGMGPALNTASSTECLRADRSRHLASSGIAAT